MPFTLFTGFYGTLKENALREGNIEQSYLAGILHCAAQRNLFQLIAENNGVSYIYSMKNDSHDINQEYIRKLNLAQNINKTLQLKGTTSYPITIRIATLDENTERDIKKIKAAIKIALSPAYDDIVGTKTYKVMVQKLLNKVCDKASITKSREQGQIGALGPLVVDLFIQDKSLCIVEELKKENFNINDSLFMDDNPFALEQFINLRKDGKITPALLLVPSWVKPLESKQPSDAYLRLASIAARLDEKERFELLEKIQGITEEYFSTVFSLHQQLANKENTEILVNDELAIDADLMAFEQRSALRNLLNTKACELDIAYQVLVCQYDKEYKLSSLLSSDAHPGYQEMPPKPIRFKEDKSLNEKKGILNDTLSYIKTRAIPLYKITNDNTGLFQCYIKIAEIGCRGFEYAEKEYKCTLKNNLGSKFSTSYLKLKKKYSPELKVNAIYMGKDFFHFLNTIQDNTKLEISKNEVEAYKTIIKNWKQYSDDLLTSLSFKFEGHKTSLFETNVLEQWDDKFSELLNEGKSNYIVDVELLENKIERFKSHLFTLEKQLTNCITIVDDHNNNNNIISMISRKWRK